MEDGADKFVDFLRENGVEIIELTSQEEKIYKQDWFARVVPVDKQQKAIDSYCFDKDGYLGYLWHVFSYEILDCIKGNEAKIAFDCVPKKDAILLVNWGTLTSCKIKNISNIKAEMIELLADVILTDCNFEWIYVKTHESACGPYFHSMLRHLNIF